jgi:hypothetical protein
MEFLKKHYEKLLLGLVLLGLVGGLVVLPFIIKADNDAVDAATKPIIQGHVKVLPDVDFTSQSNTLQRVGSSYQLDLENTNKLFNPVTWQKMPDGTLAPLRASDYGVPALVMSPPNPLYLVISLISTETNELGTNYTIQVERQAALKASLRGKARSIVSLDHPQPSAKNPLFIFIGSKGAPENPSEVDLKLTDTGEIAPVGKDQPFRRIDGYSVDLKYPPDSSKPMNGLRVNSVISFGGDNYTIVDIKANEVVLSAQSNQKRYTKSFSP